MRRCHRKGRDRIEVSNAAPRAIRGATLGFTEYEAEDGASNATVLGPDRAYGTVPAEASGRRAVRLDAHGKYVEWTMREAANALVVRYSMPDAPGGGGTQGTLSLYVNGVKRQALSLSSKYAWVYGGYPFNNDPNQGSPHRYFDETRALVSDIAKGSIVRLEKDSGDLVPYYIVDLVDAEQVDAPYARPADSLSIADYGALGQGADDTGAIMTAIAAAKAARKVLWIPQGEFRTTARFNVDHVTIRGAGPWYSVVRGTNGKGGFFGTGDEVRLLDFAMFGDVTYRDDANFDAGVDGTLGKGSMVQNLWFEHTKVGIWVSAPTDGAYVVGCRIRDTFADGLNLHAGTKNQVRLDRAAGARQRDRNLRRHEQPHRGQQRRGHRDVVGRHRGKLALQSHAVPGHHLRRTDHPHAHRRLRAELDGALWGPVDLCRHERHRREGRGAGRRYSGQYVPGNLHQLPKGDPRRAVRTRDDQRRGNLWNRIDATGTATFNAVTVTGAASGGANIGAAFSVTKGPGNIGW